MLLDVDECAKQNGGCDSKRNCTNTLGGMTCGECPAGWANEGDTGCKGLFACGSVGFEYIRLGIDTTVCFQA